MPLILGRSGTQYFAMVTKLLRLYCGALLVQSYCKESNISDTSWLRYPGGSLRARHWANSSLWKRVIAWERSRAAGGYGIIWGDADRNKQGGI